jgi:hypothetical protein
VDEMTEAVGRVGEIDPEACRHGAERFTGDRMCRGYVEVYRSLLASPASTPTRVLSQQLPGTGEN